MVFRKRSGYTPAYGEPEDTTPNGSLKDDVRAMGEYLSERYTARSLTEEARQHYDDDFLDTFGTSSAVMFYLDRVRREQGFAVTIGDIKLMAEAIAEHGEVAA